MQRRKSYTAAFKLDAVKYRDKHGRLAAAIHFNVDKTMIRKWVADRDILEEMPATQRARRYGGPRVKGIEKQHESPIESRNNYSMSYQISPDNMENLKLHQPADIDHNHIRHEALEAQSSSINHEAQMAKCLFEQCPSHLEITGPAHLFDHMITHASTRRFRCSECGTPKNRRSAFKEHKVNRIKCRGEMIDEINLKMIEEWSMLIKKCFPQHSAEMHEYLAKIIDKEGLFEASLMEKLPILAPKTPENAKPKKKREELREGSLKKYLEPLLDPRDESNGMSDMEISESTTIPVQIVEISMPQLSLLRQDVIKDEDWNQRTVLLSNASSTSTLEEQNSQLGLIIQKRNDEIRLLRAERETWNRKMVQMEQMLAGKCMETSQLREEKIASDAHREAQFTALRIKILRLEAQLGTQRMNGNIPCVQLD